MKTDPIVEEIRKSRSRHAARHQNNLDKIFNDLQAAQKISGRNIVTRPPKIRTKAA